MTKFKTPTEQLVDTCDDLMKVIEKIRFSEWPKGVGEWLRSINVNPDDLDELLMDSLQIMSKVKSEGKEK